MPFLDPYRCTAWLVGVTLLTFVLFSTFPEIDLWVSGLFFVSPGHFVLTDVAVTDGLRRVIWGLSELMVVGSCFAVIAAVFLRRAVLRLSARVWFFVVLLFVAGPGLLVNGLLKTYVGRARPADVQAFGGEQLFTAPHQWADECAKNCSFVSGEVSGAAALMIALLVILWHWRDRLSRLAYRATVGLSIAIPVLSGMQRVGAGRHFLSDVTLAALFVMLIAAVLYALLFFRAKSADGSLVGSLTSPATPPIRPPFRVTQQRRVRIKSN
jgi:lipid A 4'-phosphatase